jgi:ABC-type microcin C transport system permease subunit YejB
MKSIRKMVVLAVMFMVMYSGVAFALMVNENGVTMEEVNREKLEKISQFVDFLYHMKTPEKIHRCLGSIERMLKECRFNGPTVNYRAHEFLKMIEKAKVTSVQETDAKVILKEIGTDICEAFSKLYDAFTNPPASEMCY